MIPRAFGILRRRLLRTLDLSLSLSLYLSSSIRIDFSQSSIPNSNKEQWMIAVPSAPTVSNGLPTDLVATEKSAPHASFVSVSSSAILAAASAKPSLPSSSSPRSNHPSPPSIGIDSVFFFFFFCNFSPL